MTSAALTVTALNANAANNASNVNQANGAAPAPVRRPPLRRLMPTPIQNMSSYQNAAKNAELMRAAQQQEKKEENSENK